MENPTEILIAAKLAHSWCDGILSGELTEDRLRVWVPLYLKRQRFYGPRRADRIFHMVMQSINKKNREVRYAA